jgi:SAM-dependent methyltransferase
MGSNLAHLRNVQYGTARNFNARVTLHQRFRTNPYGFNRWLFDRLLRLPGDRRILELGCGPGWLWRANVARIPRQWSVTLTDFSPGMATEACTHLVRHHACRFGVADAQSLPFADGTFDAVIANHMLYHVPNRAQAYAEMRRVLRSGGAVFASTFGKDHMREMAAIVSRFSTRPDTPLLPTRFLLESGREELARWFSDVTIERYPDGLAVTEAEPFVAYVRSLSRPLGETASDSEERIGQLRTCVAQEIAARGTIHITTDIGLLTAIRH